VQVPVAVKEFFFQDYCNRDEHTHHVSISSATGKEMFARFKDKLIKEASLLAQFNHKNIVDVLDVFEENGTAYMIMEYIDGDSLKDVIEKEKILPVEIAVQYICDVAEALKQIHQKNILHLDIKPSNIMILKDGSAKLLDFGVSKHYSGSNHVETSTTPVGLSRGYAPPEQYLSDGVKSFLPATDIYALGATLYHCLTGVIPIEANRRIEEDLVLPHVLNTLVTETLESSIMKAMALRRAERYQNIDAFLEGLLISEAIVSEPVIPSENEAETIIITKQEEESISPEDIIISKATNVNDTMAYQNAFNAARNEIGLIGYFEWHKQLYTTSSPEEYRKWDYRTKFRMQEIITAYKEQNKNQANIKPVKPETTEVRIEAELNSLPKSFKHNLVHYAKDNALKIALILGILLGLMFQY
jgi:serine/threonine protein kinase